MILSSKKRFFVRLFLIVLLLFSVGIGISVGFALAATKNLENIENIGEKQTALPSQILDANEQLITEFFSDEKREIVSIDELPRHVIYALITREDQNFFRHNGFDMQGTLKAAFEIVTGQGFRGASTITQQLAGTLYADRTDISYTRKLVELWWAFQLERSMTKMQILESYLNKMYFGAGTYGIEAASQFYFGHSARQLTLAESVLLMIQLSNPTIYSPINHPNSAKKRQLYVLEQMVELGYATQEEIEQSYQEYWNNYDYTRTRTSTAWTDREDKAPYFSEYIRQQLDDMLFGSLNIYKDGFVVHTTLDLEYQELADTLMQKGISQANATYRNNSETRLAYADDQFIPIIDMLSLAFNIEGIRIAGTKQKKRAQDYFSSELVPAADLLSIVFGIDEVKFVSNMAYAKKKEEAEKSTVEGAFITLENETGYIKAMVGGSNFESINQFNRAVQAEVQPGSAFKPLYYSAAISSGRFTPSTMIYDAPTVFWNDDGTPYAPLNYGGHWYGPVRLRYALARSLNIPSLKILDAIGFNEAIERSAALLGIEDQENIARVFPRKYPLGLGIIRISPLRMAKAFATFANKGKEVSPVSIRYVEDRTGRIILEPEKELRETQEKLGEDIQILTPQAAYMMTDLMQSAIQYGTLAGSARKVGGFDDMAMAGKTGTVHNWSDAWAIGFSPYYTTAVWLGFDKPGNSLGTNQTGAAAAGPIWAEFMKEVHKNLPEREFERPTTGIVEVEVTARSGLLPPPGYEGAIIKEKFIAGTEPKRLDDFGEYEKERNAETIFRLSDSLLTEELSVGIELDLTDNLELPDDILKDLKEDSDGSDGGLIIDPDLLGDEESLDNGSNPLLD